jgi:aminoglycoside phosphotransferase (APT) family kinase protein
MHDDEVAVDGALVRRLVDRQFPAWAELALEPVPSGGTDNALFRLGHELVAHLPRRARCEAQVDKDRRWLPVLAPHLPLAVPEPVADGEPGDGYPFRWTVCRWLPGRDALTTAPEDLEQAAVDLAGFVTALRRIDPAGGPVPGAHNFWRGEPISVRDDRVRAALADLDAEVDTVAAAEAWTTDAAAPVWSGDALWIHGDLMPGNLLVGDGRLHAVIDFGGLGVGDPAVDLLPAWGLFSGPSRAAYRRSLGADDAAWARGRAWALSVSLIALPYYRDTNPVICATARHTIAEVLAEHR